jgi:hypothetical protein
MKYTKTRSVVVCLAVTAFLVLALPAFAGAWTPKPVKEDPLLFMPGSQPGQGVTMDTANRCDNCHGGYDPAISPADTWRGSMMAQAARDPLWLACMTVSLQDSIWALGNPNAGDLCIRCHSPGGWLGGRSDPTNTSALTGTDFDGVQCDFCHQMIDPLAELRQPDVIAETPGSTGAVMAEQTYQADIAVLSGLTLFNAADLFLAANNLPTYYGAFPAWMEAGGGQYFLDGSGVKRGPFTDATGRHQMYYSRFHKSKEFCHTCHDVSNPVLAQATIELGIPEKQAAASYFHVERTQSEFLLSDYGRAGGSATRGGVSDSGVAWAAKCQDCHMRDVAGKAAGMKDAVVRTDMPLHDLTGGNAWVTGILASADSNSTMLFDPYNYAILSGQKYAGAQIDVGGLAQFGPQLDAAKQRAIQQLQIAATLELVAEEAAGWTLRVYNNTGHKLISGFPEGRRMFLNVRFFDSAGAELTAAELNPYAPLVTTTDGAGNDVYVSGGDISAKTDELIWEADTKSDLTGEAHTFHFVLATGRYKDNRIPPKGFDIALANERISQPVWHGVDAPDLFSAAEYAGGYDEFFVPRPAGAATYAATLYYQTTSKSYIEFLRDEINGDAATLPGPGVEGDPPYLAQTDPFFSGLKGWGDAIYDLWLHNGGAAPVAMTSIGEPPAPPVSVDPPLNLAAAAGKRSVSLSWDAPATPVDGYRIYGYAGGKYSLIDSTTGLSWTQRQLVSGETYTYAVTSYLVVGGTTHESAFSDPASATAR